MLEGAVKEVLSEMDKKGQPPLQITKDALKLLHLATESKILFMFENSELLMQNRGQQTIKPKDFFTVRQIEKNVENHKNHVFNDDVHFDNKRQKKINLNKFQNLDDDDEKDDDEKDDDEKDDDEKDDDEKDDEEDNNNDGDGEKNKNMKKYKNLEEEDQEKKEKKLTIEKNKQNTKNIDNDNENEIAKVNDKKEVLKKGKGNKKKGRRSNL